MNQQANYSLKHDPDLYFYQKTGVRDLIRIIRSRFNRSAILGDDRGLGKTIQAIRVADILNLQSVLVICPASVRSVWEEEFRLWSLRDRSNIIALESGSERFNYKTKAKVVISSYELAWRPNIGRQLVAPSCAWDLIVFDEAHHLSNFESNKTRVCLGNLAKLKYEPLKIDMLGMTGFIPNQQPIKLYLTGSVMRNQTIDLFPLYSTIAPDLFPKTYWDFAEEYCKIVKNKFGSKVKDGKNLDQLLELSKAFMVRRLKRDVKNFALAQPSVKNIYFKIPGLTISKEEQAVLDFIEKDKNPSAIYQPYKELGKMQTQRQEVALAKIPYILKWIKQWRKEQAEEGNKNEPFVIFGLHQEVIKQLHEGLTKAFPKEKISVLTGSTSKKERAKTIIDFQDGTTSIFLASYAAAEGITLTRACHLMITEYSWSLSLNEQALDRIHRAGQKRHVHFYYLMADCKIDRMMRASFLSKKRFRDKATR